MPPHVVAAAVAGVAALGVMAVKASAAKGAASTAARGARKAGETAATGFLAAGEERQAGTAAAAEEIAPWRNVGQEALYKLSDEMGIQVAGREAGETGGYLDTPFYQQERADIIDAMEKSASSRGLLRSGGTMAAIGQKAGQFAARGRESYLNRLSGMAGMGYQAAGAQAQFGVMGAEAGASATERAAQARASSYLSSSKYRAEGILGRAGAISGGIEGLGKAVGFGVGGFDANWNLKGGG